MADDALKSSFLREAKDRGYIYQCTDLATLDAALCQGPISAYAGFDPTAASLHVGNVMTVMMLRLLHKHGHVPFALIGGGTAKIGDPSFRDEARTLLSDQTLSENVKGVEASLRQFLTFENGKKGKFVNNADWLDTLSYVDVLRDVGAQFSINRMLSFESVKQRLERDQGLTFLEFNYSILQSYDFRQLHRVHQVTLQIGGSDQWGNIVSGIDLTRRTDAKTVYGLTTPLITTASGAKMGKSAKGAVWVRQEHLPVFEYWQFWRNTEDADVGRFLKLFTDLPVEECARLGALQGAEINEAKKILATEATSICHGREAAETAAQTAQKAFETGEHPCALPSREISAELLRNGLPAFRLLVETGVATSNGEARRLIRGGGAKINDRKIEDENRLVTMDDTINNTLKISSGKKNHLLARPV